MCPRSASSQRDERSDKSEPSGPKKNPRIEDLVEMVQKLIHKDSRNPVAAKVNHSMDL